jgi:uncharacterized protein (DUF1684 family)
MPSSAYADEIQAWRQGKDEPLRRRDGWLALAGLHWLEPGSHTAGSSAEVDILLPASVPARLGAFEVRHGQVFFRRDASLSAPFPGEPADGAALQNDAAEKPDFLRVGGHLVVIRADLRRTAVWDNDRLERLSFPGSPGSRLKRLVGDGAVSRPQPPGRRSGPQSGWRSD